MKLTRNGLQRITMDIRGLRLNSSDLTRSFGALLQLCHLLPLDGRRSNFLTENDVTNFAGSQGGNVDAIPLAEILDTHIVR